LGSLYKQKTLLHLDGNASINGDRTFHSFRHTYVSHLRGSISEAKLTRLVGHTNTAITDQYTHTSEEDLKAVRDAVSGIINIKKD
jgi:integrase